MFTGIIESVGEIIAIEESGSNRIFQVSSSLAPELKIDQSLSHNGVCLTVEKISGKTHQVTAVQETLDKTNLGAWKPGTLVNLERCMAMNGRLDGHIVQGHVDGTGTCLSVSDQGGSWLFRFQTDPSFAPLMIEKGSISLNGISLTIFDVANNAFSVAIIPYTFEHTNMKSLQAGDRVNLEFDMIGKYVHRLATLRG